MSLRYRGSLLSATAPTASIGSAASIWALQEQYQAQAASLWPPSGVGSDEYFKYVSLLLPGNGTNGAQNNTFLDSSSNNFTVTRNGNTTQGTFSPFSKSDGRWGNFFDGTGDYLTIADNDALDMGSSDMTIEAWVYVTYLTAGTGTERDIIDFRPTSTDTAVYPVIFVSTGNVLIYYAGGTRITGTTTVSLNTWYHVAVSRLNGSTKLYLNGSQEGSTYADTNNYTVGASRPVIGCQGYSIGANTVTGYMDDIRITKGIARYTQNFIPPSVALPRQ